MTSNMHSDFKLESILRMKPLLNNLNISKLNLHIKINFSLIKSETKLDLFFLFFFLRKIRFILLAILDGK